MPNQCYVLHSLYPHHPDQLVIVVIAPELNAIIHLMPQLLSRHIWFSPAIVRNDAAIRLRAIVDDGPDRLKIVFTTSPNHRFRTLLCDSSDKLGLDRSFDILFFSEPCAPSSAFTGTIL